MGAFEVRNGRWSLIADIFYAELSGAAVQAFLTWRSGRSTQTAVLLCTTAVLPT